MSNTLEEKIAESYGEIETMNLCCGNDPRQFDSTEVLKRIKDQAKRCLEEIQEVIDGVDENNRKEILDGAVDTIVVALGLASYVQAVIGDVGDSLLEICQNNSLKYTHEKELAEEWLAWYQSSCDPEIMKDTYYLNEAIVEGVKWYCVKRHSDNKFLKPPRHPKPSIGKFLYAN